MPTTETTEAPTGLSFPINTLEAMTAIPVNRLPAFLAELPLLLATMSGIHELLDVGEILHPGELGEDVRHELYSQFSWVDDGDMTQTMRIRCVPASGGEPAELEIPGDFLRDLDAARRETAYPVNDGRTGVQFPITTLADMAAIPRGIRSRLVAEMAQIIVSVGAAMAARQELRRSLVETLVAAGDYATEQEADEDLTITANYEWTDAGKLPNTYKVYLDGELVLQEEAPHAA